MDVKTVEDLPPQFARLAYRTLEKYAASGEAKKNWTDMYEHGVKVGTLLPEEELFTARSVEFPNWAGILQIGLDPSVLGQKFSLLHATDCRIEGMGMLAGVMMTAQNCRAHLNVLEAHGPMLEPNSTISIDRIKGGMSLTVNYPHISGDIGRVFCESGFHMWEDYLVRATGWMGQSKQVVTFHYAAPTNASDVNETFFSDVFFDPALSIGASGWTVQIPDSLLDHPNPHYNAVVNKTAVEALLAIAESRARKRAEADGTAQPFTYQAREAMFNAVSIPSQAKIAQFQGVTPRALQNRLKSEGTTYQMLRDDVEIEKCKGMLLVGKSVPHIAGVLGVSAESLHRKFKKITGSTPKNFAMLNQIED